MPNNNSCNCTTTECTCSESIEQLENKINKRLNPLLGREISDLQAQINQLRKRSFAQFRFSMVQTPSLGVGNTNPPTGPRNVVTSDPKPFIFFDADAVVTDPSTNITLDSSRNRINVKEIGTYSVSFHVNLTASAPTTYTLITFLNGAGDPNIQIFDAITARFPGFALFSDACTTGIINVGSTNSFLQIELDTDPFNIMARQSSIITIEKITPVTS
ncbi:MAG: hypothetical protein Hyperionvirus2_111 [Hyperionvirus sp.]|uniref:Uncharacterized protein n=1 Tax=Hyperionvirus sp. TaxID=2487770 RepID=A0A3G5AA59_9VIRU|nr:MAG: hypothetical protein Hyperionvirus2_111 [Hyperionvirus sp.]